MVNSSYFKQLSPQPNIKKAARNRLMTIQKNFSDTFFQFKKPVKLTINTGIALVVVTNTPNNPEHYETYVLHQSIELSPEIYFNVLTVTPQCSVYLEPTAEDEPKLINVAKPFQVTQLEERIHIKQLYSLFYQMKTAPYHEPVTHQQNYYQLIMVDQGKITLQMDQSDVIIGQHECVVIFPDQSYSQHIIEDGVTTYISILFDAEGLDIELSQRVIRLGSKYSVWMERLVKQANNSPSEYHSDELLLDFKTIVMGLINGDNAPFEEPMTSMRENYENELFQSIVDYLHEHVEQHNEVNDLVDHFSLSRSTLQMLFRKYANTTPKAFINQMRLQRSKIMIRESKMSLSEIANQLGYGSIQYFSRAFSRQFGMNPSNYAKSLIK